MKDLFKRVKAYTLTEIVIVMLIIAVIVAVSLKITKAHMDSVVKYTYYSAYDLLSSVTGEMITDSDLSEQYGDLSFNLPSSNNKDMFFKTANLFSQPMFAVNDVKDKFSGYVRDMFMQRAYAASCSFITAGNPYDKEHCSYYGGTWCSGSSYEESYNYGDGCFKCCSPRQSKPTDQPTAAECKAQNMYLAQGKYGYSCSPCPSGYVVNSDGTNCDLAPACKTAEVCAETSQIVKDCECEYCPSGTQFLEETMSCSCPAAGYCAQYKKVVKDCECQACPEGTTFGYVSNTSNTICKPNCTEEEQYNDSTNTCVPKGQVCSDGEIFDADLGQCRVPQTADDCTPTQVYDKDKQLCREKNITLPQDGNAFCDAFVSMTNTNKFNCSGKNTAQIKEVLASGDFSNLEPDIVLRNGMRLYNVKNPAVAIKKLEGNTSIAMQTPEIYSDSLIRSIVASIHTLSDKLVVFLQNLTLPKAYATSVVPNETQEACACWADTYPNCRPASETCPPQGSLCHVTQCNSDQYYDYNVCACVGGSASTDPDDSTTACAAPICDEGYELDTSKGECGECLAVTDTDDKDSSEVTIPTLDGLNEKGYIVYVDIDGERGDSILYEDVYPFYITFSGLVIPGYEKGQESGGNSKGHLSVSVKYDTYGSSRKVNWMNPKSTDFRHAACMSKYVTATNYCTGVVDNDLSSKHSICSNKESDCRIVPNKPLKF